MISLLKSEWITNPNLKHWNNKSCVQSNKCKCNNPQLVELWEQDSCTKGRIDTVVCTKCNQIQSFKIIR